MADPVVRTGFPGGNGTGFIWSAPNHLQFEADPRGAPCCMWFYFTVENPTCDVLHCEMTNGKTALGWPYHPHVRPLFRHQGENWRRTPPSAIDKDAGRFEFDVACERRTTEICFCYPYMLPDWQAYYDAELHPLGYQVINLGKTGMGRDYFIARLGTGRNVLWLQTRAHSGETPGSYVMEGMLAELGQARAADVSVIAVPFVDLDGVQEGMYGKNRPPLDFNRGWHVEETRPEIRLLKQYIAALPAPPRVAVDLHAPTAFSGNYICHSPFGLTQDKYARLARLVQNVMAEAAADPAAALDPEMTCSHDDWFPDGAHHGMCGHFKSVYGALAFTLENAYHASHLGAEVGPDSWLKLGRILARHALAAVRE